MTDLDAIATRVVACSRCPRLSAHRKAVAAAPPRRHVGTGYWAKPVPGMGDPAARLLVVGLAPGAHGANRTGAPFHGDTAGDVLFAAMHAAGFASHPAPVAGLTLHGAWLTNAVKCVPPANLPSPAEVRACADFLHAEVAALPVQVIVALGAVAWRAAVELAARCVPRPRPRFGHLAEVQLGDTTVLASYHPSRHNTHTGRLTEGMLEAVFARAGQLLT